MFSQPVAPDIREADLAIRMPWSMPPRCLLDYLLLFVQEGDCLVDAVTPYVHLDLFYNPRRAEGFPTRGG